MEKNTSKQSFGMYVIPNCKGRVLKCSRKRHVFAIRKVRKRERGIVRKREFGYSMEIELTSDFYGIRVHDKHSWR